MTRLRVSPDRRPMGLGEWMPAGLAILLGMMAVAISGMMSFGYLMVRPASGSDVGGLATFAAASAIAELPGHAELWRGIPRQSTQAERDVATQRAVGLFEPRPIQPSADDVQWLRAYCLQESHFRRMEPNVYKMCGGFHADWAVVFSIPETTAEFAFCFGCDEVKILVDGYEPLHLDLYRSAPLRMYFERYLAK